MNYRYLEDVAIADVAFEAFGKTLPELFKNAALATEAVQAELESIGKKLSKTIRVEAEDEKQLLYDFLEEIIYLKDAEQLLFSGFKIQLKKDKKWNLVAACAGQKIGKAMKLHSDVKAVTWHLFELKKARNQWYCRVVLDI